MCRKKKRSLLFLWHNLIVVPIFSVFLFCWILISTENEFLKCFLFSYINNFRVSFAQCVNDSCIRQINRPLDSLVIFFSFFVVNSLHLFFIFAVVTPIIRVCFVYLNNWCTCWVHTINLKTKKRQVEKKSSFLRALSLILCTAQVLSV